MRPSRRAPTRPRWRIPIRRDIRRTWVTTAWTRISSSVKASRWSTTTTLRTRRSAYGRMRCQPHGRIEPVALVPPNIEALRPYEAGRTIESVRKQYGLTRIAKLASNENPLGTSPKAVEAMAETLRGLNLYPDGGLRLREVLAAQFDLKVENVIAGSGSEGIMSNIIRTFLGDEDEVLTTEAAFIGFQVLAKSRGVAYRTVPYRDWHYDLAALAGAINDRTKIIYLANPNNPTGTIFSKHEFDEF